MPQQDDGWSLGAWILAAFGAIALAGYLIYSYFRAAGPPPPPPGPKLRVEVVSSDGIQIPDVWVGLKRLTPAPAEGVNTWRRTQVDDTTMEIDVTFTGLTDGSIYVVGPYLTTGFTPAPTHLDVPRVSYLRFTGTKPYGDAYLCKLTVSVTGAGGIPYANASVEFYPTAPDGEVEASFNARDLTDANGKVVMSLTKGKWRVKVIPEPYWDPGFFKTLDVDLYYKDTFTLSVVF